MQHPVEALGQYRTGILDGSLDEPAGRRHRVPVPGGQVIEDHDVVAGLNQSRGADAADVTRPPGD